MAKKNYTQEENEKLWDERNEAAVQVDNAFRDAEQKRSNFLLLRGWCHTSDFPDCIWRYVKTVKGQTICLNAEDAFRMERNFIEPMEI